MAIATMHRSDSISEALDSHDREFKGDPIDGKSADIDGILPHQRFQEPMSGHPAMEPEEPETGTKEKDPPHSYGSQEEAERAAEQTQREIAKLSAEVDETRNLALNVLSRPLNL